MMGAVVRVLSVFWRDLVVNGLAASALVPRPLRWRLLRTLGLDVARSTIYGRVFFGGRNVTIGKFAVINYGAFIDNVASVHIGEKVRIGPAVSIITGSHEIGESTQRAGANTAQPVVIGDGVWIGARVTILPGVIIGDGAVVAAGSVVVQNCKPDSVYAGVPAKLIRELSV